MGANISSVDTTLRALGRRLLRRYPEWESGLLWARDRYARAHVRARYLANAVRYTVPPDPYRFIEVDPASVEYMDPVIGPKYRWAGTVEAGEWDRTTDRFADTNVFQAYERHFEDGVPWRETAFYERVVEQIESGRPRWGCRTREEFDERCERLDRLYENIRTDGYRTQNELLESGIADPIKEQHALKTERLKDEVAVNIGRDGRIFWGDGRNRLSIAKLLELDSIPVRVLRRHRQWQALRDAYVRGHPIPDDLRTHPDLVGLPRGERE